jgi:hypothetical protein
MLFLIYSLQPIILFASMDVSRHILVIDTSVLTKSNMGQREYKVSDLLSKIRDLDGHHAHPAKS